MLEALHHMNVQLWYEKGEKLRPRDMKKVDKIENYNRHFPNLVRLLV